MVIFPDEKIQINRHSMKKWVSRGLLWAVALYAITIIIIPIADGEKLSAYKIILGIPLWLVTGLAIGSLFYNKEVTRAKTKRKNRH